MFKSIMVPLDGSRASSQALRYAVGLAQRLGSEVIVVRAVSPTPLTAVADSPDGAVGLVTAEMTVQSARLRDERNLAQCKRYLRSRLRALKQADVKASSRVAIGQPAQAIIEAAHEAGADLIVMRSHGKGRFKRAILGSVTDKVVREARLPVMVIPAEVRRKKRAS